MRFNIESIKKMLSIDELNKNLDEIEDYLDFQSMHYNNVIKKRKLHKPCKDHKKVDSQWMIKTAAASIKRSFRKVTKHM